MISRPVNLICPVCAAASASLIAPVPEATGKAPDHCPDFGGVNPLPKLLHLCPDCGFTGFEADYRLALAEETRTAIRRVLASLAQDHTKPLSGAERYRRAALLSVYIGRTRPEIAELYLQATWCSRLDGEPEHLASRSRLKAIDWFQRALDAGDFREDDLPAVYYLIGELKRRSGKIAGALADFARVDEVPCADPEIVALRDKQRSAALDNLRPE
jgi:uncharacterized protein (DUF2225 family)